MIEVEGMKYYTPREIANQSLIVNSKNKGDYAFILTLIRKGLLNGVTSNTSKNIAYKVVSEAEIDRYNKERFNPTVKL